MELKIEMLQVISLSINSSNLYTYIHIDSSHSEHLNLVVHAGHEPEELLAILVPLDAVQLAHLQVIVADQGGRLTQDQLLGH